MASALKQREPKITVSEQKERAKRQLEKILRELDELRITKKEIENNPEETFRWILMNIRKIVVEENIKELTILTPFMYRKFVEEFIEFINKLRREVGNIVVTIITRSPKYVNNKIEHVECIEMLRKANIIVCEADEKIHAKAVILGDKYIIGGSVNPLAPSYFEITIGPEHLIKLINNPYSASSIKRLFGICLKLWKSS